MESVETANENLLECRDEEVEEEDEEDIRDQYFLIKAGRESFSYKRRFLRNRRGIIKKSW